MERASCIDPSVKHREFAARSTSTHKRRDEEEKESEQDEEVGGEKADEHRSIR